MDSINFKKTSLLNNYNLSYEMIHPVFDRITIYQDKYLPSKRIFSKVRICYDQETYQEVLEETSLRFELNHPNILTLIDFSVDSSSNSSYKNEIKVSNFYNYPEENLDNILRNSLTKHKLFNEQQLIKLGMSILSALNHLYEHELFHGDLRPQYIGINDMDQFVLLDRLNESSSLELQKFHVQNKQKIYMSQELLQYIKEDGSSEEQFNALQSELFSLGMILLECGLEEPIQNIYDYEQLEIKQNVLQKYMQIFKQKYSSQKLIFMIDLFLNTASDTDISDILNQVKNFRKNENENFKQQSNNFSKQQQPLFQNQHQNIVQINSFQQSNSDNSQTLYRQEKPSFNPQNPQRKSRVAKNHQKEQSIDHPQLGAITLLNNSKTGQKIFSKNQTCGNFEEFGNLLEQIRCRFEANHPNILKIIDYSTQDLPNNPQNQKFQVTTYFEYPKQFLKQIVQNKQLSEKQLEKLISDILSAFVKLQEMDVFHKDLRVDYIAQNNKNNFILVDLQDSRTSYEIQQDRINQNQDIYISEQFFQYLLNNNQDEDQIDNFCSELFGFGLILIELALNVNIQQIYNFKQKKIEHLTLDYLKNQFKSRFYKNEALCYIIEAILNFQQNDIEFKNIVQNYKNFLNKNKKTKSQIQQQKKNKIIVNSQPPIRPTNKITNQQLFKGSVLEQKIERTSDQDHEVLGEIVRCQSNGRNYEDIFEKEYFCQNKEELEKRVEKIIRRLSLNHVYILKMIDYAVVELKQNSMQNKYKVSAFFQMPYNFIYEYFDRPSYRRYKFQEQQIIDMCYQILRALQHLNLHNKNHKNLNPKYIAQDKDEQYILIDELDDERSFEEIQRENIRNQRVLYLNEETLQVVYSGNKNTQIQMERNLLFALGLILMQCFVDIDVEDLYDYEHLQIDKQLLKSYKNDFIKKSAKNGLLQYMIEILIPEQNNNEETLLSAIQKLEQFRAKKKEQKKLGIQFKNAVRQLLQRADQSFSLDYKKEGMIKKEQIFTLKSSQQQQSIVSQNQYNRSVNQEPLFVQQPQQNNAQNQTVIKSNLPIKTTTQNHNQRRYITYKNQQDSDQPQTRRIYVRADRSNSIIKRMNEEEKNAQNGRQNFLQSALQNSNFDEKYKGAQLVQQQGNFKVYRLNNESLEQDIQNNIKNAFNDHINNPYKRVSRIVRVSNNKPVIRSKSNMRYSNLQTSNMRYSKYKEFTTQPVTVSVERRVSKSSVKRLN